MLDHKPLIRKLPIAHFLFFGQRVQLAFLVRQTAVCMVLFQPQVAAVCQALGLRSWREMAFNKQLEVVQLARAERGG